MSSGFQEHSPDRGTEKPSAKTLLYRMQPITDGRLRDLGDERLYIAQQDILKQATACKLCLDHSRGYLDSIAADLHDSSMRGSAASEE